MIINLPTYEDFENAGHECLIQAYKNICQIDDEELRRRSDREEIWTYHKIVLKTSIILTYQGLELLLKAHIAKESPLLLIEQKRAEWKTLPDSKNVDFSGLFTISGDDLIRTFYATINPNGYDKDLIIHFEELRVLRNRLVHSVGNTKLTPDNTLKLILRTFTLLSGKDSFWYALNDKYFDHPASMDDEEEPKYVFDELNKFSHLEYLEYFLGKGELNKHFHHNFKSRRYFCPDCTGEGGASVSHDGKVSLYPSFRYSFLNPNTPDSTEIECIVCGGTFDVERINCNKYGCKGNVIYTFEDDEDEEDFEEDTEKRSTQQQLQKLKICLTCNEEQ